MKQKEKTRKKISQEAKRIKYLRNVCQHLVIMDLYVNFDMVILEEEFHTGLNYPAMKLWGLIYF
jgi:hypothetical protein